MTLTRSADQKEVPHVRTFYGKINSPSPVSLQLAASLKSSAETGPSSVAVAALLAPIDVPVLVKLHCIRDVHSRPHSD